MTWVPLEPPPCPQCGKPLHIQKDVAHKARCFTCCPMSQAMDRGEQMDYAGPLGIPYDLRNLQYYKRRDE